MAANYRSSGRARSRREFASRMALVLEEADETVFWIELLTETAVTHSKEIQDLAREVRELVAIFAASHRTASRVSPRRQMTRSPDDPTTRSDR